jgi:hypothetical protein
MPTTNKEREIRIAQKRVEGFAQEFGEAHRNLARHAAFPLVLTPDLLYQIWANFVPEAPWTAVAHVLLSRLCRQVGYEMYEMDIADRNLLLRELKGEFGQERFNELGEFLLDYVAQRLTDDDADTRDLREAQEWTALAYTKPGEAARELAQRLSERMQQDDIGEVLRLASLVETWAEPLMEEGFEHLLVYSRGVESLARSSQSNNIFATLKLKKILASNVVASPKSILESINLGFPKSVLESINLGFPKSVLESINLGLSKSILDSTNLGFPKSILDSTNLGLSKSILDSTNLGLSKSILDSTNLGLPKSILDSMNLELPKSILDSMNLGLPKSILDSTNLGLPKSILDSTNLGLPKSILDSTNLGLPKSVLESTNLGLSKSILNASDFTLPKSALLELHKQKNSISTAYDLQIKHELIHKLINLICSDSVLIESAIESELNGKLYGENVSSYLIPDDNNEGTIDEVG